MLNTRQCQLLSVDPLDEHYFLSASVSEGANVVSLWDRRVFGRAKPTTATNTFDTQPLLQITSPIDSTPRAKIWNLRFSGHKRGCFTVLSNTGQLKTFDAAKYEGGRRSQAQHFSDSGSESDYHETWYMKMTTNLASPIERQSTQQGGALQPRIISFDHLPPDALSVGHAMLALRSDKSIETVAVPGRPAIVALSPTASLSYHDVNLHRDVSYSKKSTTIAQELSALEERIQSALVVAKVKPAQSASRPVEEIKTTKKQAKGRNSTNTRSNNLKGDSLSSRERHDRYLDHGSPYAQLGLTDMLQLSDIYRRRCMEGYLLDIEKNKHVVEDDHWLVAMWDTIHSLQTMAERNGMVDGDIDLSYLGILDLWQGYNETNTRRATTSDRLIPATFSKAIQNIAHKKKIPDWDGVQTAHPWRRQLCLLVCGYFYSNTGLRAKCMEIYERDEAYKAVVVAYCHGQRDLAIELIRTASRAGVIEGTSLAAVIASDNVPKSMRSLCEWMAEDAQDLYLKALLAHFVAGDWAPVVAMSQLPLLYRVAIALRFLPDAALTTFLTTETAEAITHGDVEGVVLTGLAESSMDLFQAYITKTGDVQTAVLATARTNPRYVDDARWDLWKESYFWQMQGWREFIKRAQFTTQHNRAALDREGNCMVTPPPAQIALRCNHCQQSIARLGDSKPNSENQHSKHPPPPSHRARTNAQTPAQAAGTRCPKCNRPLPRCAICMLWLGSPDPSTQGGAMALAADKEASSLARVIYSCIRCGHGCHAHHASEWFAKHVKCPVPDCTCSCGRR